MNIWFFSYEITFHAKHWDGKRDAFLILKTQQIMQQYLQIEGICFIVREKKSHFIIETWKKFGNKKLLVGLFYA